MTHNDLGGLVETCQRIPIKALVDNYKSKLKDIVLNSEVKVIDTKIQLTTSKTGNGGFRWWFLCPRCQRRVGILFKNPISRLMGCRVCLKLKYRSNRFEKMVETTMAKVV